MILPEIHILAPTQWRKYKSIRLQALKDSPDAFGSTYDRESVFTDEVWRQRVSAHEADAKNHPLVVEVNSAPVGLASGRLAPLDNDTVQVYQMWVTPDYRGCGIGKLLLNEIVVWAESIGIHRISLSVTNDNSTAKKLYLSYGFTETGEAEPLRDGSEIMTDRLLLDTNTLMTR